MALRHWAVVIRGRPSYRGINLSFSDVAVDNKKRRWSQQTFEITALNNHVKDMPGGLLHKHLEDGIMLCGVFGLGAVT